MRWTATIQSGYHVYTTEEDDCIIYLYDYNPQLQRAISMSEIVAMWGRYNIELINRKKFLELGGQLNGNV